MNPSNAKRHILKLILVVGLLSLILGFSSFHTSSQTGSIWDSFWNFFSGGSNPTPRPEIKQPKNTKFDKITFSSIPSAEEFLKDPSAPAKVTIRWKSDAPPGVRNGLEVYDATTKKGFSQLSGIDSVSCNTDTHEAVYAVPFETKATAEIKYETCVQSARNRRGKREYRLICSGCGCTFGCGSVATREFTTPSLPLPTADIKANDKDGNLVFVPGVPVALSWSSDYALSCVAEGSWSGNKSTSGTETVVPKTKDEIYTIACRRDDKVGRDSVSSAAASGAIKITGSSGGGSGRLQISSYNVSAPLNPGDTITVSWDVQNAKSCEIDNGVGQVSTTGSANVTFIRTTTFTLTCVDDDGNTISAQRTVKVKKIPGGKEILPE